ncbi:MAG: chemotaxis protein CheW [Labilithrix sp.]|nr:chemotaxis protein CheW [Labilithrix sp.]
MSESEVARRVRELAETFDRSFASPARVREDDGRPGLAVRVGGDPYLLFLEGLSSVSRKKAIVPLPGGSSAQLGVSGIRGALVGVFSLPALLGYDVALARISWLAVAGGARPVALAFEGLDGQVVVPPSSVAAAPSSARRHVSGLAHLAGEPSARGVLDLGSMLARIAAVAGGE